MLVVVVDFVSSIFCLRRFVMMMSGAVISNVVECCFFDVCLQWSSTNGISIALLCLLCLLDTLLAVIVDGIIGDVCLGCAEKAVKCDRIDVSDEEIGCVLFFSCCLPQLVVVNGIDMF